MTDPTANQLRDLIGRIVEYTGRWIPDGCTPDQTVMINTTAREAQQLLAQQEPPCKACADYHELHEVRPPYPFMGGFQGTEVKTMIMANPGSERAREQGCTCPILDNSHGEGYLHAGSGQFVYVEGCPMHWPQGFKDPIHVGEPLATPTCDGSGWITRRWDSGMSNEPCPGCPMCATPRTEETNG